MAELRSDAPVPDSKSSDDQLIAITRPWDDYTEPDNLPVLLQHALDAFVDNGYHGTSVRELAKRLGQTVPAIYYHHENKQAILVALLSHSIDDLLGRCAAAEESEPDDPRNRFAALVRTIVLFVANRRQLAFLDNEIRALEPPNRSGYIARRDEMEAMLRNAVDEGSRSGAFSEPDTAAVTRAVLTMCRGIADWHRPDGRLQGDELAAVYVRFALRLVGDREAASPLGAGSL